ncbi:MAG: hypothetical protein HOK97_10995 [Deltaproteobacteria bacterium]|jgi:hypothetical protein|nr:hypothetical protein [Deltaproteobacteria bacterium]
MFHNWIKTWGAFAVILLTASFVRAEKPSAIALPLEGQRIDDETVGVLNQIITGYLSQIHTHKMISMDDVETMLGFEQKKQILDCDSVSCLPEIGGALGVDEILRGTVGKLDNKLIIGFTLMNIREATVKNRVTVKIDDDESEYDQGLRRALWEVFELPEPVDMSTEMRAGQATSMPGALSWALWGTGVAALGTGAYFGSVASSKYNAATTPLSGGQTAISEGQSASLMANILYGTGAALFAAGVVFWIFDGGDDTNPATARITSPTMVPMVGHDLWGLGIIASY